jgi:hypothetical protein
MGCEREYGLQKSAPVHINETFASRDTCVCGAGSQSPPQFLTLTAVIQVFVNNTVSIGILHVKCLRHVSAFWPPSGNVLLLLYIGQWFFFFFFFPLLLLPLEHRTSVKRFISLHFLNLRQSVGLLGRGIRPSQGRYLTQTQNKRKQTSIPWVGFEPTIPAWVL